VKILPKNGFFFGTGYESSVFKERAFTRRKYRIGKEVTSGNFPVS
jgi:hypothetical protein